ncbi:MAG: APC family permease [Terrimicrobiaceae bacterium]
METQGVKLSRSIGLFALIVYGVGDMVGAGIYGTIGVAAGHMGNAVWLSFLVSMLAALLTGLTYASLSSRYPYAAGTAYVAQRAFGSPFLSYVVGLAAIASGLTSMAAGGRVFAATLGPSLPSMAPILLSGLFLLGLTVINFRGIKECVWVNVVCTAIEVGGLLLIIGMSIPYLGSINYLETPPDSGGITPGLVMTGAVLTFFAFVGFEDLLNLAEEVKDPERTMPRGIILAVLCTTIIYILVSLAAVSVVPYARLADPANGAPMAQIAGKAAVGFPPWIFTGITLFAVANTALMNFIMGSRLVYGMSRQKLLPEWLGVVHHGRKTPHRAILVLAVIVAGLSLTGGVADLASATSLLLLLVFALMNAALLRLKFHKEEPRGRFEVPLLVPVAGVLVCAALIIARVTSSVGGWKSSFIAAAILGFICLLFLVGKNSRIPVTEK